MPSGAKVLVISIDPGVSSVDARIAGFNKKAAELGYVLVSDTQYSHNQARIAAQVVSAALAKDPDLAGVFATNLFTAQGIATGVKQAGGTNVKIVGFDAGPDQIKQLEAGDVQALVAQKPYDIGVQGVQQAVVALNGVATTPEIQTESLVVTAANMTDPDGRQVHLQVRLRQLSRSRPASVVRAASSDVTRHGRTRATGAARLLVAGASAPFRSSTADRPADEHTGSSTARRRRRACGRQPQDGVPSPEP